MVTLAQSSPGDRSARAPQSKTATVMLGARARGNHGLHGYSTVGGGNGKRATQGQDPLPHSNQAQAKLVVRAQSAAIVAYTYPGTPPAVPPFPQKLPAPSHGHTHRCPPAPPN